MNFLLQSLATGELNRTDYDELMAFIHSGQSDQQLLEGMDKLLQNMPATGPAEALSDEALYRNILAQLPAAGRQERGRRYLLRRSLAVAASVLLVAVGLVFYRLSKSNEKTNSQAPVVITVSTLTGQRKTITLPDSSRVWLNAGSSLHYPAAFAAGSRELLLEGEACFDVREDARRPFIVHTGKLSTTVLGTVFDINTYDSLLLLVTVSQGKVKVGLPGRDLALLTPNKQLQYRPLEGKAATLEVNGQEALAWKNGELLFSNTTMEEAAAVMSRWFGTRFEFSDPAIRQYRFSISFHEGVTIGEAMNIISTLNHFSYRVSGNTVVLTGK